MSLDANPGPHTRAYQLAYLLVGEAGGAAQALLETVRLHARSHALPWNELALAALRQAAALKPDRFFLRTLAHPEGLLSQVDRLPESERCALLLDACGEFSLDQMASLLRLPTGALAESLARTWRRFEAHRASLWAELVATVPPMEQALQRQLAPALTGDESVLPPLPGRAPRRRKPWLAALALVAVLGVLALRWWLKEPEVIPTETTSLIEAPAPASNRFDPSAFKPEAVQSFMTTGIPAPIEEGAGAIATKVFQWIGEATFVEEAPAATVGDSPNSLSLRFTDGRVLWLLPDRLCWSGIDGCAVVVGGEGKIPIRLSQIDLSRWMVAGGWLMEFGPHSDYLTYPDQGARTHTEEEIRRLSERDRTPGLDMWNISTQGILTLRQENGLWRTSGEPGWQVVLRSAEAGKPEGEMLTYRDRDGALIQRRKVTFVQ
ncbi:MAG TPA: hypothetical protein VK191_16280 [Symbiobacteriaceae bacterium]|nr:hypothetical protein [Symbiobacteriaceae bacterium]